MPESRSAPPSPARAGAASAFGRLRLTRLLGRSDRTMAWQAADPGSGRELMVVLPRQQPGAAAALQHWQQTVRQGTRLVHPQLAAAVESGVQDGWPYVAYELGAGCTLADRRGQGLPGAEAAGLSSQLLRGLAYAHDAGVPHHDLQDYLLLVDDAGRLRLAGLAVACLMAETGDGRRWTAPAAPDPGIELRAQRDAGERDVLAAGLLLHAMLCGASPLDEPDTGRVIARLPPLGREILRLPWTTAQPVPEALRAIVNRATGRQQRQRYRSARTLLSALEGWLQTAAADGGGPLALLSDRLRTAGLLPSSPGAASRAARLALMERERTNELAEVVLEDLALSFEMLRLVNSAQVRGAQVAGSGPVLTVRRSIAMLGLDGVRRGALAMRPWPGPLGDEAASALQRLMARCQRAARAAMALRPAGYDGEVVYLVTLLQNLGRLVVHYHYADEAQQIRRLMQPAEPVQPGEPEEPGMSEEQAAFAVLGADIESIGAEVAHWWGLDDGVLALIRRLPLRTPVRAVETDDEMLRTVASCANEAADALGQPSAGVAAALQRVAQRYDRVLSIGVRDLQAALQDGPGDAAASMNGGASLPQPGEARPGTLRARALAAPQR